MTIALLCMVVQTAWAQFSGGSGTPTDPYQISSVEDWNTLATNVEAGENYSGQYFKLTKDIDNIETLVGSEGKPFSGHFYGNGKQLKVSLVSDEQFCALFRCVNGATITNLKVGGIILATAKFAGSLVGQAKGNNFISGCHISTILWSQVNGNGSQGGVIGIVEDGVTRIDNCLFTGKLEGSTTSDCGGFVGWKEPAASINLISCLFDPESVTVDKDGGRTFVRYNSDNLVRIDKCYFISDIFGFGQGYSRLGFPASDIAATLGSGWTVSEGHAVPDMNAGNIGCAYTQA